MSSRLPYGKEAVLIVLASLIAVQPGTASAQTSAAGDASIQLSEVVVTAQKRQEDLKNVPLSITVLKGDALEDQNVVNYQDLGRIVPGLAVTNTGGSSLSRLSLRGIASEQGSSPIGIYLEDISITLPNEFQSGQTLPRMFDLDHVEVLRGPQGTLFGASSLGGAIRFIPNQPKLNVFEGEISVEGADTHLASEDHLVQAIVNVPIIDDKVALRVGVQTSYDSGFVTRYDLPIGTTGAPPAGTSSEKVGDEKTSALRASLLVMPEDGFSIEPAALWQRSYANGTNIFDLSYLPEYAQNRTTAENILDVLFVPSLTVHKDFAGLQATSITSYTRRDNDRLLDDQAYDGGYLAYILDPNFGRVYNAIAALPGPYHYDTIDHQLSQELRLGSKSIKESGQPFEWQVGAYYANQSVETLDDEAIAGLGQTLTALYGEPAAEVLGAPLINDEIGGYHYTTRTTETALFGQVSYMFLPKLTATVGGRESLAHINYFVDEFGYFNIGLPATYDKAHSEHPFIPKFSLSYEMNDEATIYTTVAKGYRLGGQNIPLPSFCAPAFAAYGISNFQGTYDSDSLWSYELGTKLRLFDDRISVNAAGYYVDWKNIQQNLNLSQCGYSVTVNAGSARSYGGEVEIIGKITKGLSVTLTGALTDATITNAAPGTGAADGQAVLFVPKSNISLGSDFEQPLTAALSAHAHVDVNYTGTSHGTFLLTDPDYKRPDYTVVNLTAGVTEGPVDILFFARNLFDDSKVTQHPSVLFVEEGVRVRPRTLGVSVKYKF